MRIVSLLPAATEIVAVLGQLDKLVAVSHECNHPAAVNALPRATHCAIDGQDLPSDEIDRWVTETLARQGTLYTMDEALLHRLEPDLILTQRLCDVCAIGYGSVEALARDLPSRPEIVSLEPSSVQDIFDNIQFVADKLGISATGREVVAALEARRLAIRSRLPSPAQPITTVFLEWVDPLYCGGHWNPEIIEDAGGFDPLGRKGEDSVRIPWESVQQADPEVLVIAACGQRIERTLRDIPSLTRLPMWDSLTAVRNRRVWVMDGTGHFSRPGPRVIDSAEMLATVIHPEHFAGRYHWPAPETPVNIL
jgi:iron complex transport system substrate-binding protein